jgi:ribonuclease P protein component
LFEPEKGDLAIPSRLEHTTASAMNSRSRVNKPVVPQSPESEPLIRSRIQSSRLQSLTGSRLQKHADYQRAYAASRKRQSSSMSWFLARQTPAYAGAAMLAGPRVGLTAGKVLGKAHERNRIKRRMREALRRHVELLPDGFDLILHPRRIVLALGFAKLEAEIVRILHQARAEARSMPQQAPHAMTRGPL